MATLQEGTYKRETKHDASVNGCVHKMAEHDKILVIVILLLSKIVATKHTRSQNFAVNQVVLRIHTERYLRVFTPVFKFGWAYSVNVATRQALLELISANQILELKQLHNDICDLGLDQLISFHLCILIVLL